MAKSLSVFNWALMVDVIIANEECLILAFKMYMACTSKAKSEIMDYTHLR